MQVPEDALAEIFGRLHPFDIDKCALVCRAWKEATDSMTTWMLVAKRFGLNVTSHDSAQEFKASVRIACAHFCNPVVFLRVIEPHSWIAVHFVPIIWDNTEFRKGQHKEMFEISEEGRRLTKISRDGYMTVRVAAAPLTRSYIVALHVIRTDPDESLGPISGAFPKGSGTASHTCSDFDIGMCGAQHSSNWLRDMSGGYITQRNFAAGDVILLIYEHAGSRLMLAKRGGVVILEPTPIARSQTHVSVAMRAIGAAIESVRVSPSDMQLAIAAGMNLMASPATAPDP
jgi:hypothetical protein